jgi:hypothetical protein
MLVLYFYFLINHIQLSSVQYQVTPTRTDIGMVETSDWERLEKEPLFPSKFD